MCTTHSDSNTLPPRRGAALARVVARVCTALLILGTGASGSPAWAGKVAPAAQDEACMRCHDDIFEEAVVHTGIEKGCRACHGKIDASVRPHKLLADTPAGLNEAQPQLCWSCHERSKFAHLASHKAADKEGCAACHEMHASKHKALLKEPATALCQSCHKKEMFTGKVMHSPVRSGKCLSCHDAHGTGRPGLLTMAPSALCLDCHEELRDARHVVAGFTGQGHPLGEGASTVGAPGEKAGVTAGDKKAAAAAPDPRRPGRKFSCASCHEPHRSQHASLMRDDPSDGFSFCMACHPK